MTKAANHWTEIYNRSVNGQLSEQDLAAAAAEYDTDLKAADATQTKIAAAADVFAKALGACDQPSLPKDCQDEFAQYQANIDHEAREAAAYGALYAAIGNQQNAVKAGDRAGMNAATEAYNTALDQVDAAGQEHDQLSATFKVAQDRCNKP